MWSSTGLMSGFTAFFSFFTTVFSWFCDHNNYSSSYRVNTLRFSQKLKVEFHRAHVWAPSFFSDSAFPSHFYNLDTGSKIWRPNRLCICQKLNVGFHIAQIWVVWFDISLSFSSHFLGVTINTAQVRGLKHFKEAIIWNEDPHKANVWTSFFL